MSPGISEEAGATAREAISALKNSPSCLLAILLAGTFAVLTYFSLTEERRQSNERELQMAEKCFPLALMKAMQAREMDLDDYRRGHLQDRMGDRIDGP